MQHQLHINRILSTTISICIQFRHVWQYMREWDACIYKYIYILGVQLQIWKTHASARPVCLYEASSTNRVVTRANFVAIWLQSNPPTRTHAFARPVCLCEASSANRVVTRTNFVAIWLQSNPHFYIAKYIYEYMLGPQPEE